MADIDLARQMERLLTEMQGVREEMGSIYAELNSVRAEMANMRDQIRALSTTVLRMDGSVQSMAQELGAISGLSPSNLHPRHRLRPATAASTEGTWTARRHACQILAATVFLAEAGSDEKGFCEECDETVFSNLLTMRFEC
jgi:hypothetical protein